MKLLAPLGVATALSLGMLAAPSAFAQFAQQAATPVPTLPPAAAAPVQAQASDVASVDAVVAALYDVISGPAGKARDWNRMRSLFTPEARMMAVGARPDGTIAGRALTVEDYIARNTPHFAKAGFFEREVARTTEVYGQIAHVFSTYEARHAASDAAPFARGINSIQLYNDGKRWWVVNLMWRAEDKSLPLPERYLKSH